MEEVTLCASMKEVPLVSPSHTHCLFSYCKDTCVNAVYQYSKIGKLKLYS